MVKLFVTSKNLDHSSEQHIVGTEMDICPCHTHAFFCVRFASLQFGPESKNIRLGL